jgi:ParB family chromosome partitioning protein
MIEQQNAAHVTVERSTMLHVPPEQLLIIKDKNHILYDPRAMSLVDENMILSVMENGILEPVLVRQNGSVIEVVAGRQRVMAAIEANKRLVAEGKSPVSVPILSKKGTDAELLCFLISENELRKEDTALSRSEKMSRLKDLGLSTARIGVMFGVTRQHVENAFFMDSVPDEVKKAIDAGKIKPTAVLELKGLSPQDQIAVINCLIESKSGSKNDSVFTAADVKEIIEKQLYSRLN